MLFSDGTLCQKTMFHVLPFSDSISCPQNKVKVNYWYTILSWNNNVLCFTIYLTWYSMPIGHGYAIFDWTFCHETMFYVLPFTWPDSLYFFTFTFEGRFYLATMIYVLCITICHLKKSIHLVTSLKLGLDFGTTFCHEIMLYVLPSTWPMPLHHLIFWWNILVWNNVLCFMFYHLLEPICYCL